KVKEVDDLWFEILGPEEFLQRPRMSRILYRGKLYDYPLKPVNALRNLGPVEAVRCVGSYAWVKVRPPEDTSNLEGFYVSQFGWRLYEHFFRRYNEKVWGVPTKEMSADFGAQRSKGMSLMTAIVESLTPKAVKARRGRAHVPRLHDRRARRAGGVLVPRQLDLHPRPGGEGRTHPELRLLVAVPREGGAHLPRPRVLRERGRRHVDQVRRGPGRAGQ